MGRGPGPMQRKVLRLLLKKWFATLAEVVDIYGGRIIVAYRGMKGLERMGYAARARIRPTFWLYTKPKTIRFPPEVEYQMEARGLRRLRFVQGDGGFVFDLEAWEIDEE